MNAHEHGEAACEGADPLAIDVSDTDTVPMEYGDGTYRVLDSGQRERIDEDLCKMYCSECVSSVQELSHDWKESSYSDEGQTFERIFDAAIDIDKNERNTRLDGRSPSGHEPEIACAYHRATTDYLHEFFGDSVGICRGIRTHDGLVEAVKEVLSPSEETVSLQLTKLSNFTTDTPTADAYGVLRVECSVEPEDVAFAPDFFLPYNREDGITRVEAELRVIGDSVDTIRNEAIRLPESTVPLKDAIRNSGALGPDEHQVVAGIVKKFADADELVPVPARDAVVEWYYDFFESSPEAAIALNSDVETVTGREVSLH